MADIKINNKIETILDSFGMSGRKAAEAMGISYGAFRQKRIESQGHQFTGEQYNALVNYIKRKAVELTTIHDETI